MKMIFYLLNLNNVDMHKKCTQMLYIKYKYLIQFNIHSIHKY